MQTDVLAALRMVNRTLEVTLQQILDGNLEAIVYFSKITHVFSVRTMKERCEGLSKLRAFPRGQMVQKLVIKGDWKIIDETKIDQICSQIKSICPKAEVIRIHTDTAVDKQLVQVVQAFQCRSVNSQVGVLFHVRDLEKFKKLISKSVSLKVVSESSIILKYDIIACICKNLI